MAEVTKEKKVEEVITGDQVRLPGKRKWHNVTKIVDMRASFGLINLLDGCKQMPLQPDRIVQVLT